MIAVLASFGRLVTVAVTGLAMAGTLTLEKLCAAVTLVPEQLTGPLVVVLCKLLMVVLCLELPTLPVPSGQVTMWLLAVVVVALVIL